MLTEISLTLSAINIAILLSLIYVYSKNYRKLKSQFSLGLLTFATILLIENTLSLYFNWTMMGLYAETVAQQVLTLRALQTAALIILSYITWRN